jgi:ATP-dependent RNA helicase MRH4, mitochondrial
LSRLPPRRVARPHVSLLAYLVTHPRDHLLPPTRRTAESLRYSDDNISILNSIRKKTPLLSPIKMPRTRRRAVQKVVSGKTAPAAQQPVTKPSHPPEEASSDIYSHSDREAERLRKEQEAVEAATAQQSSNKSRAADEASSDIYSHSDRGNERLNKSREVAKGIVAQIPFSVDVQIPRRISARNSLAESERRRDLALSRLEAEDTTTTASHASRDAMDMSDGSVEVGRRLRSTPAQRRDTTGIDLEDTEIFGGIDSSFDHGTRSKGVRSADTSSLNMSQFKRRARAPSMSGTEERPIRPSSRGPNTPGISSTFNIGAFRRRARQPSILGTARKNNSSRQGSEQPESEADDFAPEAESTPLNRQKIQDSTSRHSSSADSKKRKRDESSEAEQPEDEPRQKASCVEEDIIGAEDDTGDESESEMSLPSPRYGPLPRPTYERPVTPIGQDEIMAPPASSGSEDDGNAILPDIRALGKRRRHLPQPTPLQQHEPQGHLSDVSSPPSLTHSPNFPPTKKGTKTRGRQRKREPSPVLKTADLTSMLPRRRHKTVHIDPFGLGSSEEELEASGLDDDDDDDDELAYSDARKKARRPLARAASRNRATSRPGSRGGKSSTGAGKNKHTPVSTKASKRTYGSKRASDKENQDDDEEEEESFIEALPDDMFDEQNTERTRESVGEELANAAKKFKEVDRWELAFEEITEPSSPPNAR